MTSPLYNNKSASSQLATSYFTKNPQCLDDVWKHTAKFHWTNIAIKGIGHENIRENREWDDENQWTFAEFYFSGDSECKEELDAWWKPNLHEDEPDEPWVEYSL